jgi:hypothetical protein
MAGFEPNQPTGQHRCDCGALYDVTWGTSSTLDQGSSRCECCQHVMAVWNATSFPIFKLVGGCPGA